MSLPIIKLTATTTPLVQTFSAENLRPGGVTTLVDYAQGQINLRETVTFSATKLSGRKQRQEIHVPMYVTSVDTDTNITSVTGKSLTRIIRDYDTSLATADRVSEFERIASLFDKVENPDFYNAFIKGSPLLGAA